MSAISISTMIFGTLVFIPCVLGNSTIVDLGKSFDDAFDYPNVLLLCPVGLVRNSFAISMTLGGMIFWYYWSFSTLKSELSFIGVILISGGATGLVYLIYQYLRGSPVIYSTRHKILIYFLLMIGLLGSITIIWIPAVVFLASQLWKILASLPLVVSAIVGYFLFTAGLFLFLLTNQ